MSELKKNPSATEVTLEAPSKPVEAAETLESLTKQVAKGGGIAFGGSVIGKVATFGLHILLGGVLGPRSGKVACPSFLRGAKVNVAL